MLIRILAGLVCLFIAAGVRADLPGYIAKADTSFEWKLKGKADSLLGTVYDLHLVSQTWQDIKWEHALQVYLPLGVRPTATIFLWNQGGKPSAGSAAFGLTLAAKMKAPVAFLFGIPNQPLFNELKEDALIAETFVRCLDTGNEDWPLLFPMVKSLVKSMDALQAFSEQELKTKVTGFVVSGASKRGWTTWLTGASDPRVKAIAPAVIDMLNLPEQLPHQVKCFGTFSEMIGDYTCRQLVPIPDTEVAQKLWKMVDPYSYRDKLTIPKLIVLGANDRYWTVDALNFYWDGLKGDKWVIYVPNAGHNLEQDLGDSRRSRDRAVDALAAFGRCQIHGSEMPKLHWKYDDVGGKCLLNVAATPAMKGARVWVADSQNRDFRPSKWTEQTATLGNTGMVSASIVPPASGFRAYFVEVDYNDGQQYRLSTQMRVVGATAK